MVSLLCRVLIAALLGVSPASSQGGKRNLQSMARKRCTVTITRPLFPPSLLAPPPFLSLSALGTFVTAPSDVIVAQGSTARFDCIYLASFPISISWQKNGTAIADARYSGQANGSLIISSAQAKDAATYTCVVLNLLTGATAQSTAILQLACEFCLTLVRAGHGCLLTQLSCFYG